MALFALILERFTLSTTLQHSTVSNLSLGLFDLLSVSNYSIRILLIMTDPPEIVSEPVMVVKEVGGSVKIQSYPPRNVRFLPLKTRSSC